MDLKFCKTPRETWDTMLADCRTARVSIEMEQYIVADDPVGRTFLELFLQKLKEGVAVRLLLDRIGSREVFGSDLVQNIVRAGGLVEFYNPPGLMHLFRPALWFPRNHTKTLLVDSEIAWIGGVCLDQDMADWRDTQVRFTGPAIDQVVAHFSRRRAGWRTRFRRLVNPQFRPAGLPVEYIMHRPQLGLNPIYRELMKAIHGAKQSVSLVTPYFLAPFGLRRALAQAARRGVRVSIMMPAASDVPLADCVSHSWFPWMYRKGIRIFLYQGTVLHAKYAVVDDTWATVGSTNLDYLSLRRNREANIVIHDPAIVATLQGHYEEDLAHCAEAGRDYWRSLPLLYRILGYAGRSLRKLL
ncbi:MAG: phosphatidylserine/phosphatidylglycerophosphate/cardiolipin synthase family protein [Pseudomonadota bacterium]|nr:phosphatidylserine/phosphatidylglycerophosphate/cardiolipin synthase family protein [Pseudomonadota bacterium]